MSLYPDRVYLIDGSGYIFRAYHALPPLSRPDGTPVGAVYGFVSMLIKLWGMLNHHPILVVFDAARITFRHTLYPDYKANRAPTPEDLIPQFALIRQACDALGLPWVEDPGVEADDLIASYAKAYAALGVEVVILSSDKDLMQLMTPQVRLYDPMKNKPINEEDVIAKFGVAPDRVIDVQALCGDSVDNVPGVPSVGIKTAAQLIQQYGSLEGVYANIATMPPSKRKEKLEAHKADAFLSKELVILRDDVPLPLPLSGLKQVETLHTPAMRAFLEAQHFITLLRKFTPTPQASEGASEGALLLDPTSSALGSKPLAPASEPYPAITFTHSIITSVDGLKEWAAAITAAGRVAVDTETTGLDTMTAQLVGISLAIPGSLSHQACYIPLAHNADLLSDTQMRQLSLDTVITHLGPVLADPSVLKIAHNAKYDAHILYRHGLPTAPLGDTMLMSYVIAGSSQGQSMGGATPGHSLDALAATYFGYTPQSFAAVTASLPKNATFADVPIPEAAFYAAEDAYITARLFAVLLPKLVQNQGVKVYETLERPLSEVLRTMESTGIKLDTQHLEQVHAQLALDIAGLSATIYALSGIDFNIASPQQLSEVLFEKLHIPPIGKRGKNGAYSTNVDVLEKLKAQGIPLADLILQWRQLNKLQTTYTSSLVAMVAPATQRLHTTYNMVGTSTGRLSSSHPNLQNIPIRTALGRTIRQAFVSRPGWSLVSFDYSQIELRLMAHMADVPTLIEAFHRQEDIHTKTAAQVFHVPLAEVTADQRREAKAINFGIIYGMGAWGLSQQLNISAEAAGAYIKNYFAAYPGIQDFMHRTIDFAKDHGYVLTLAGRRCWVPDITSDKAQQRQMGERQAINAPLQGTAADIIKAAMIAIHEALPTVVPEALLLLQVHDELIFEVSTSQVDALVSCVKPLMEGVMTLKVPLVVAHGVGPNWDACHA